MRAGTPATTQRSGTSPRTTAPAATTTCSPICAPGRMIGVGAQPAARPDANRRLGRPLAPDGHDRVLVGVVLVGDVDVGTGLDVVTDDDLPVPHDVRSPADEATAADRHDRVGRHVLARCHPGRNRGVGAHDGLGSDVDEMLVVEGTLGEEEARAMPHPPESPPTGIARPDRPELECALPRCVDQTRQGPAKRSGKGTGPAHAGMLGARAAGTRPACHEGTRAVG